MVKITYLIKSLQNKSGNYQHLKYLTFSNGEIFSWDYKACVITYNPRYKNANAYLLHEFSHAILNHNRYTLGIDLLKMEQQAWSQAKLIALELGQNIDFNCAEESLDTYRDWLHNRSICPNCQSTGIETKKSLYFCPNCSAKWKVNEARTCGLKRTLL